MTRSFITILLLVGTSLLSIFYIRPQWAEFSLTRKEVESFSSISTELDEIIEKRDTLLVAVNTISKDNLDQIDKALPQGPRAADFLVTLENIVLRHSMSLKRIDVASLSNVGKESAAKPSVALPLPGAIALTPKPKLAVAEFPFSITISGTYESFKNFLRETESLLRITTFTDIAFTSTEKSSIFDFTMRGKIYYQ